MSQFPYLPLFVDAFRAATDHLSDAEKGRYLDLLMIMWSAPGCKLPNDDEWLARRFKRSIEAFRAEVRPIIDEFCQSTGNWITQKRLAKEFEQAMARSKKASVSANLRWNKEKSLCDGNAGEHAPSIASIPIPIEEREETPPSAVQQNGKYFFKQGVIRLSERDFHRWKAAFPFVSLEGELLACAEWAATQPRWFNAVAGLLAKRNRIAQAAIEAAKVIPTKSSPDPEQRWKDAIR